MDMDWNSINGAGPNVWRWDATDLFVREARSYGLAIVAITGYSPRWAEPASCPVSAATHCLPASPETYAAFAHQVAARYGSLSPILDLRNSIEAWQVWNEPNHYPFVQPTVDVAQYTAILKRGVRRVQGGRPCGDRHRRWHLTRAELGERHRHGARDVPQGHLQERRAGLLRRLRRTTRTRSRASPLYDATWNAFTQTRYLHDVMAANGDGAKKIWATEAGAPTASNVASGCIGRPRLSLTEAQQAQWVADYLKGWTQKFG